MVVIGGSFDQDQAGMGGFQELHQVEAVSRYCKYATRLETLESIPYHIEKVNHAWVNSLHTDILLGLSLSLFQYLLFAM